MASFKMCTHTYMHLHVHATCRFKGSNSTLILTACASF